jgi:hypothetical protein
MAERVGSARKGLEAKLGGPELPSERIQKRDLIVDGDNAPKRPHRDPLTESRQSPIGPRRVRLSVERARRGRHNLKGWVSSSQVPAVRGG